MGNYYLITIQFQFGNENILEMDGGDGYTTV